MEEINSHFFSMYFFAEKILLQMMWTFALPAKAQFGDQCSGIDGFTKERK